MKYQYYINFNQGAGDQEFMPDKDPTYEWRKDDNGHGFMRKKIKTISISRDYDNAGTLINKDIFDTLWEWYFDISKHQTEINLKIYKNSVLDHETIFYVINGDIDINNGNYTVKPVTDDLYKILLSVEDVEVDLVTEMGAYTAVLTETTTQQDEAGTVGSGGEHLPPDIPPYDEWVEILTTNVWRRQVSQYDLGTGWTKYGSYWYNGQDMQEVTDFEFPNCYLLTESIQLILDTILEGTDAEGMTLQSHFFYDTLNYVTGDVNKLMNTLIEQRSDTKDPDATNKASVGKVSFKQMMNALSNMFDVEWYIDGTDLRIEHRKFFYNGLRVAGNKSVGIDLTDYAKYYDMGADKYYLEDTQQFSPSDIDVVKQETIKFMDEDTVDFRSDLFYIEYDVITDLNAEKENNVTIFSTDVRMAINRPDDILDDGFFMFNCEALVGTTAQMITRPHDYTNPNTVDIANAAFWVKWLLHDYYEYGRFNKSGTLRLETGSTTPTTYAVISSAPIFQQKDIVFLLNDDDEIDINKYIAVFLLKSDGSKRTIYGNIIKIEHNLYDDFVKVTLGFEL